MRPPVTGSTCPWLTCRHGHELKVRRAGRAGTPFLGCSKFPECRETASLEDALKAGLRPARAAKEDMPRIVDVTLWTLALTDPDTMRRLAQAISAVTYAYVPSTAAAPLAPAGTVRIRKEEDVL